MVVSPTIRSRRRRVRTAGATAASFAAVTTSTDTAPSTARFTQIGYRHRLKARVKVAAGHSEERGARKSERWYDGPARQVTGPSGEPQRALTPLFRRRVSIFSSLQVFGLRGLLEEPPGGKGQLHSPGQVRRRSRQSRRSLRRTGRSTRRASQTRGRSWTPAEDGRRKRQDFDDVHRHRRGNVGRRGRRYRICMRSFPDAGRPST